MARILAGCGGDMGSERNSIRAFRARRSSKQPASCHTKNTLCCGAANVMSLNLLLSGSYRDLGDVAS
jgi:hypothetical protein